VGTDRNYDLSESEHVLDDQVTISYYLLRSFIEINTQMAANVRAAGPIAYQRSQNGYGFELCNTMRNTVGSTGIPECIALFALGKFSFSFFLGAF
jgi:hypothetical protein